MSEPTAPLDHTSRRMALLSGAAALLPLLLQLPTALAVLVSFTAVAVTLLSWRQPLHGLLRFILALALIGAVLAMSRFSFGRDTGCALLAAMIAIKPAETFGIRDARSLLGFSLFAPFATFLLDQGPVSMALGLVAVVLILATLQRLAERESGDTDETVTMTGRLRGVGRLLAIGLPLALAAFWLFPRLDTPLWGVPERALARPGLSGSMTPGEWIDLIADDSPAARVRFFGETPPTSLMYWRGPVLWNFDGREWTQAEWTRQLPPAEIERGPARWDYRIDLEPTDRRFLVALEMPLQAPDGTALTHDYTLRTRQPQNSASRWRMQSAPAVRNEVDLHPAIRREALALPEGFNPRTRALAAQWRSDAGTDDAAIVKRSLDWIRREFVYTLVTPLPGRHLADEFLFDQKAGFCEHYSSAFVILMRSAGIPARVVTGYVGGYRNPYGDYWLVRRSDAHAWAEVWLKGRGWVRVDPTAAVAPERIYDTLADRAPGAEGLFGNFGGTTPLLNMADWMRRGWNDLVLGFDANRQQNLLRPLGIDRLDPSRLALVFSLAAALSLAWMLWLSARGQREPDPVLRAWHAMARRYARLGLGREPHETANDWAERVSLALPHPGDTLRLLSHRFSQWRYAGGQRGTDARRSQHASRRRDLIKTLRAHRPPRSSTAPDAP